MTSEIAFDNGKSLLVHAAWSPIKPKVQAFFQRQFISPTPMDVNKIHIDFEKTDGSRIGGVTKT